MRIDCLCLNELVERVEHVDFLRGSKTACVFANGDALRMLHHVKVTCTGHEFRILNVEASFATKVRQHEIFDKDVALCATNMSPLLVSCLKGTIEARRYSVRKLQLGREFRRDRTLASRPLSGINAIADYINGNLPPICPQERKGQAQRFT